jgi:zinc protease
MRLNWKKGPGYKRIEQIQLPYFEKFKIDNGIDCITLDQGTQEIFKLELLFRGARLIEHKKIASRFTSSLMREGTKNFTSGEIAEAVDFYGASLRMAANLDFNFISLTGLTKHLEKLLPIFTDILYHPIFPEDEIEKYKKSTSQKLQMDLAKNETLNYRMFTETLFNKEHPYGYNTEFNYINDLDRSDLLKHHEDGFGVNNCTILIGGKLAKNTNELLNHYLGKNSNNSKAIVEPDSYSDISHQRLYISSKNEHQASIRIGRKMFTRHHPDFAHFFVLNTVLGGYFGSRLMETVREDLGLTYNIYSIMDHLVYDGYFYIETEVAIDTIDKTIEEIYKQMDLLKSELISEEELTMVKNYLLGNFLNLVDGPFNTLGFLRSLELDNATKEDFDTLVSVIKNVDAKTLRDIAVKYFDKEKMLEVVVSEHQN